MQESQFIALAMEHGGRPIKSADAFSYRLARLYEAKLTNLPPLRSLAPRVTGSRLFFGRSSRLRFTGRWASAS